MCLHENVLCWLDLYKFFCFVTVDSITCIHCKNKNETHQQQIYVEMEVPPEGSILGEFVQEQFHESIFVDYKCEICKKNSQAEKQLALNSVDETKFIIVLLSRTVPGNEGNIIVSNKIDATHDITLM